MKNNKIQNTITLYKGYNPNLFGGWFWSLEEVWNDWDHVYSDPYIIELPEGFYVGECITGQPMIFKKSCNLGYDVCIGQNSENGKPHLVGGHPVENITLKVIGPADKKIEADEH
ncbi:MAG: hypothetical protein E7J94_02335 [Clostridium sp.]|uniref:hypothetical protein n=1 Tax=Faecalicatena contorta TaxID=39482 RepID=UPI002909D06F|nr:hypothetical protein [Clostridium sp.]